MTIPGNGVWTWADRQDSTAKWCVDLADGMFSFLFRLLPTSNQCLNNAAASSSSQDGSSRVNMNSQGFTLSAGDSILIPEQTQWVKSNN